MITVNDNVSSNDFTRKDLADLLYLVMLIWQWETGKTWEISFTDTDIHHRHVEYLFRLARLVQFEYIQRLNVTSLEEVNVTSPDEVLERDDALHHGKLSIFE